jgi:hypothetical protein
MSAVLAGNIEGISARYAAQIRELLYLQAVKRMVADQEAARAEAQAQREVVVETRDVVPAVEDAVKIDMETERRAETAEPVKAPELKEPVKMVEPAQLIDELA